MRKQPIRHTSYDIEATVEMFHWWFVVRKKLLGLFLSFLDLPSKCLTIDIGCSVGSNLSVLESSGFHVIGIDRSLYALSFTQNKGRGPLINGDLNELPIRSKSVELIVAMDILEHLDNDTAGISEFYRVLKRGGNLILTVPAYRFLWGVQDNVTGHKRRYTIEEIENKLKQERFDILRSSYFNFFLFFPILLGRRLMHVLCLKVESENRINFPILNFFLKGLFSIEVYLLKCLSFPFGVSIFCICRKR